MLSKVLEYKIGFGFIHNDQYCIHNVQRWHTEFSFSKKYTHTHTAKTTSRNSIREELIRSRKEDNIPESE